MGNDLAINNKNTPNLMLSIFDVKNTKFRPADEGSKFYFLRIYKNGKIIYKFVPVLELSSGYGCILEVFS